MRKPEPINNHEALIQKAQQIKKKHASWLLTKANVVGVGVGKAVREGRQTDQVALVVLVSRKLPPDALAPDDLIPSEIEGVLLDVQEVGELKAQQPG